MPDWMNALRAIGGVAAATAIDGLADSVKGELGVAAARADAALNFEHAGGALDRLCRRSGRASPDAWVGEYAARGHAFRVQVVRDGDAAVVVADPVRVPAATAREHLALYLLLRNGGQARGAWRAREAGGQVELCFLVRLPLAAADGDAFAFAVAAVGAETVNLLQLFDS